MDDDLDIATEVLTQHQIESVGQRVRPGLSEWRFVCYCGDWRSDPFKLGDLDAGDAAKAAGLRHQAVRVLEAIRLGAPEAPDADPGILSEAPDQPVPAAVEAT